MNDDLISRQEAIEALLELSDNYYAPNEKEYYPNINSVIETIKDLHSAEKRGKWIPTDDCGHVMCSKCNIRYDWISYAQYYDYCPKCGTRMEE